MLARMSGDHERFESFAIGHVLGGLDPVDGAEFRAHLVGCRTCRAQVAELRELAADLAAADREARAAAALKTEVVRREDPEEESGREVPTRLLTGLALVATVVLVGLGFWNFSLRDQRGELIDVAERSAATLQLLAEGRTVPTTLAPGTRGVLTVDDERFAMTLSGVPTPSSSQAVIVWLEFRSGEHLAVDVVTDPAREGLLALQDRHLGAAAVIVTLQDRGGAGGPDGRELVRAELAPVGGTSDGE